MSTEAARDSPLPQSLLYEAALRDLPAAVHRLKGGTLALYRRLPLGPRIVLLPRAAAPDMDGLRAALDSSGLGRNLVLLAPDRPAPQLAARGAVPLVTPQHVAELALGEPEKMRRALHQKWRNRLNRAENSGLRVTETSTPGSELDWLLDADRQQQRQRGYRAWPEALTRACVARPGSALILTAWHRDRPVAAVLLLCHGAAATYHIGHSTALGRQLLAHNLLIWRAMARMSDAGCARLDLGFVDTETAPGLARFKLGTGAACRPLGGTWAWWPASHGALRRLAGWDSRAMTGRVVRNGPEFVRSRPFLPTAAIPPPPPSVLSAAPPAHPSPCGISPARG